MVLLRGYSVWNLEKYKTWRPSADQVHASGPLNMDQVFGSPLLDKVHAPPILTTPKKMSVVNENK